MLRYVIQVLPSCKPQEVLICAWQAISYPSSLKSFLAETRSMMSTSRILSNKLYRQRLPSLRCSMTHARHPYLHFAYGLKYPLSCYYTPKVTFIGLCFELGAQYPPTRITKMLHTSSMLHLHMHVCPLPQWHGANKRTFHRGLAKSWRTHTHRESDITY